MPQLLHMRAPLSKRKYRHIQYRYLAYLAHLASLYTRDMFGALKNKLSSIAEDAAKIQGKLSSAILDPSEIVDPGHQFGPLWEIAEYVERCRLCETKFQQLVKRKHHCRSCAGVYCDDCCPLTESDDRDNRICLGCRRGENPSESIQNYIRSQLEAEGNTKDANLLEKLQNKALAKVNETFKVPVSDWVHAPIKLYRGSAYPDDAKVNKDKPLPSSGYFEFVNKSRVFCCIKLLATKCRTKFEVPRPSYLAGQSKDLKFEIYYYFWSPLVPPNGSIYGHLDPDEDGYELFLLYDNPNPIPESQMVHFDTTGYGASPVRISKCALVSEFTKFTVFKILTKDKNVFLKYKGDTVVLPRKGDSFGRVGLIGKLQGKRFSTDIVDYSTNISTLQIVFCS